MKKIILVIIFLVLGNNIQAADKIINCNADGCSTTDQTPLFEANNIWPGFTQNKVVQINNNREGSCSVNYRLVGETNPLISVMKLNNNFLNNSEWISAGIVDSRATKDMVMELNFDRSAGNEFQNKSINMDIDLGFECQDQIIVDPSSGIFINEIYPYPIVGGTEWVEIYNDNNFAVKLNNWRIRDSTLSNGTTFSIQIAPKGLATIENKNQFFNNTGSDTVRLMNYLDTLIDNVSYSDAEITKSFSKQTDNSWCFTTSSQGFVNYLCNGSSPNQNWFESWWEWLVD